MSAFNTCRHWIQVGILCGLTAALTGCGNKAAPAKPAVKATASATNAAALNATNLANSYASVFEELPPPKGRDPFYPGSHRRDVAEAAPATNPATGAPADPVLVLKAIIHTSRHSQAVVNNEILEAGEEGSVRVPNGKVRVRCLEIGADYVLVQVEGEGGPKRLMMEQKK